MQTNLIEKARARRRIALSNVAGDFRSTAKVSPFRRITSMSVAELSDALVARRTQQTENIFAA